MAKVLQHRFPLAASGHILLSTVRVNDGTNSRPGTIPEATDWFFTNIGTGTLHVTPYFNGIATHAAYTVGANDSTTVNIAGVNDWKIEEVGGAVGADVTVVGYEMESYTALQTLATDINTNAADIITNTNDISDVADDVATNASAIESLTGSVSDNTSDISDIQIITSVIQRALFTGNLTYPTDILPLLIDLSSGDDYTLNTDQCRSSFLVLLGGLIPDIQIIFPSLLDREVFFIKAIQNNCANPITAHFETDSLTNDAEIPLGKSILFCVPRIALFVFISA